MPKNPTEMSVSFIAADQSAILDQVWDESAYIADLNHDVESTMREFEELVDLQCREDEEAWTALEDLRRVLGFEQDEPSVSGEPAAWEPNPDEPLTISQALCLPELGGRLFADRTGVPSKNVRPYAIRNAIAEGRLQLHPTSQRGSHKISRNNIKEWIESKWQDVANRPASNSKPSDRTKTAASKRQNGSSNITTREREKQLSSAQASVLLKLQRLKNTSRNG
ncbi:hypothetical protein [Agrobacterium genomosp. 2]|uniref:Uncharacterized protein n=1 Tax=Agrobacterium genomosp. 2 str. CFBP 5494 TaxID=1183436 RepID=A0A9W5F4I0_9HYPH|nr:hypothetical protein [Agrobacterium genomosp. 2]CUW93700.1 hypothetical protein AGR2A_Cc70088 [Agrobacterium genomosp. 2 str. CFBP 5494]